MIGFRLPTHVHIAEGSLARLGEVVRSVGASSTLLVLDRGLANTEWPAKARRVLDQAGLRRVEFDTVEPNPRTTTAERAAELIREQDLQAVVGLGGGSVLDAAKAAAMLATNSGKASDFVGKNRFANPPLPLIAIPTTCGTGSEVTWVSVLSDPQQQSKISVKGDGMFPDQALVDAELIRTLPADLVAWTGVDAMTHALEAITCRVSNPVSDAIAGRALALLFHNLEAAAADINGQDSAREAVMRGATLAGIAFGNADVAAVHCLSETLGGLYDVPHGLANAVLLLPVLRYNRPHSDAALASVLPWLSPAAADGRPTGEAAERVIELLAELLHRLAVPTFAAFAIPTADYPRIAERAVANGSNDSNPRPMTAESYLEILQLLL